MACLKALAAAAIKLRARLVPALPSQLLRAFTIDPDGDNVEAVCQEPQVGLNMRPTARRAASLSNAGRLDRRHR